MLNDYQNIDYKPLTFYNINEDMFAKSDYNIIEEIIAAHDRKISNTNKGFFSRNLHKYFLVIDRIFSKKFVYQG